MCNRNCVIDGVEFKNGDWINFSVWAIHHSDKYWNEPNEFRPERLESEV